MRREELAAAIREHYIRTRRAYAEARTGSPSHYRPGPWWDGGRTRGGVQRRNYWLVLADLFRREGVDYRAYIDFVFRQWEPQGLSDRASYLPQPNVLGSRKHLEAFRKFAESPEYRDRRRRALEAQKMECHQAILKYEQYGTYRGQQAVLSAVLSDSSLSLSALFRYCVAVMAGLKRLERFYEAEASAQYARAPREYDEVWGDWIPRKLREREGRSPVKAGGSDGWVPTEG